MKYIARNMIQLKGEDGNLVQVFPGEELADFETWPYISRQAHLRQGNVEAVGQQNTGNISIDQGYLSMGAKATSTLDATLVMEKAPALDEPVAVVSGVICTLCDKSFTRPARLKAHMEKHHS